MKTIRPGSKGDEVEQWQYFLIGEEFYLVEANRIFDEITTNATKAFQQNMGLKSDAIVGPNTIKIAESLGFKFTKEEKDSTTINEKYDENWPAPPNFESPSAKKVDEMFGHLAYKYERGKVKITNDWYKKNIITINIPQLNNIQSWGHKNGDILFHTKAAKQMIALWNAWEKENLLNLVTDWNSSYSCRFIRGSKTRLSNHAYGTAFDINIRTNGLGKIPALVGKKGSVRKLVPLANKYGFYWGGHYRRRKDGMHFEVAKIIDL